MKFKYDYLPNGYRETIEKGLNALRVFSRFSHGIGTRKEQLKKLKDELENADVVVIGAGAGMSTSAGFILIPDRKKTYILRGYFSQDKAEDAARLEVRSKSLILGTAPIQRRRLARTTTQYCGK